MKTYNKILSVVIATFMLFSVTFSYANYEISEDTEITQTVFENFNTAATGGVFCVLPQATLIFKDDVTFKLNNAQKGGAIYNSATKNDSSEDRYTGTVVFEKTSTIINNKAEQIKDNLHNTENIENINNVSVKTESFGGGIYTVGDITFSGNVLISSNTVNSVSYAGIVDEYTSSTVNAYASSRVDGGGLCIEQGNIVFESSVIISSNTVNAISYGGTAIGDVVIPVTSMYSNSVDVSVNSGTESHSVGGGICNSGDITFNGATIISSNTANAISYGGECAGAKIMVEERSDGKYFYVHVDTLVDGFSEACGGGILNYHGTILFKDTVSIVSNTANAISYGGIAIGGVVIPVSSSDFNVSVNAGSESIAEGGGIFNNDGTITFNGDATINLNTINANAYGGNATFGTLEANDGMGVLESTDARVYAYSEGGGIFNYNNGTITFNGDTTINLNTINTNAYGGNVVGGTITGWANNGLNGEGMSESRGGGIFNYNGEITFNGNTIINSNTINTTSYGGNCNCIDGVVTSEGEYMNLYSSTVLRSEGSGIYNDGNGVMLFNDGAEISLNTVNANAYGGRITGDIVISDYVNRCIRADSEVLVIGCGINNYAKVTFNDVIISSNTINAVAHGGEIEKFNLIVEADDCGTCYESSGASVWVEGGGVINYYNGDVSDGTIAFNGNTNIDSNTINVEAVSGKITFEAVDEIETSIDNSSMAYIFGGGIFAGSNDVPFGDRTSISLNVINAVAQAGTVICETETSNNAEIINVAYVCSIGGGLCNFNTGNITFDNNVTINSNVINLNSYGGTTILENPNINVVSNAVSSAAGAGIYNICEDNINFGSNVSINSNVIKATSSGGIQTSKTYELENNTINGTCALGAGIYNIATNTVFNDNITINSNVIDAASYGTEKDIVMPEIEDINTYNISPTKKALSCAFGGGIYNIGYVSFGNNITINSNMIKAKSYSDCEITSDDIINDEVLCSLLFGEYTIAFPNITSAETAYGGAIYNIGEITFNDGVIFKNNSAIAENGDAKGGAIYNLCYNIDFIEDLFLASGTINLTANTKNVEFTGNTANGVSSAIYNNSGTINLWSSNNAKVIFNDRISGTGTININQTIENEEHPTTGIVELNANMEEYSGDINLYNGTVKVGSYSDENYSEQGTWFNNASNVVVNNATIDTKNSKIDSSKLNNLEIENNLYLKIDVNAQESTADTYTITGSNTGIITINDINFIAQDDTFSIQILDGGNFNLALTEEIINKYNGIGTETKEMALESATVNWNEKFEAQEREVTKSLGVSKSEGSEVFDTLTYNKQCGQWITKETGDTLYLVNTATNFENKNFVANESCKEYIATTDVDNTYGTLNIIGGKYGDDLAIINLNGYEGFNVTTDNVLNISNIKITGTDKVITNNGGKVSFNDTNIIEGQIIGVGTIETDGITYLEANMEGYSGNIKANTGTIKLGEQGTWFNNQENLKVVQATIYMVNNKIQTHNFNNLKIENSLYLTVDVDLANKEMDTIVANNFEKETTSKAIEIKEFNILTEANEYETVVKFTDSQNIFNEIFTEIDKIESEEDVYKVVYNNDGTFTFIKDRVELAPVLGVDVAKVGGYIMQSNVMNQAFTSMEQQKIISKTGDRNAYQLENGMWIRPFGMQETVKVSGAEMETKSYGTLAGVDFRIGEKELVNVYAGVAGSDEKLDSAKVDQIGYTLGASLMYVEDNWYVGLTANVGTNKATVKDNKGEDEIEMMMYAVGLKAAYDIEVSKVFSIEPGVSIWYGNSNSKEYESKRNTDEKIKSETWKNIEAKPIVRAKLNLGNDWTPYAYVGYAINLGDKGENTSNRQLDEMGEGGYCEYGIGCNKKFGEILDVYLQGTGRSGGREGIGASAGIKFMFGNNKNKKSNEEIVNVQTENKSEINSKAQTKTTQIKKKTKKINKTTRTKKQVNTKSIKNAKKVNKKQK